MIGLGSDKYPEQVFVFKVYELWAHNISGISTTFVYQKQLFLFELQGRARIGGVGHSLNPYFLPKKFPPRGGGTPNQVMPT